MWPFDRQETAAATPYGRGYVAGYAGKPRIPPANFSPAERERWQLGYEDALRTSIDSKARPGSRPSMTR
jgi:hypothetical protein